MFLTVTKELGCEESTISSVYFSGISICVNLSKFIMSMCMNE